MTAEENLDRVILWVDDSPESAEAKRLLSGIKAEYEERSVDQAPENDLISPPCLQTLSYRYSGVNMIRILVENPDENLEDFLKRDREGYLAKVKMENELANLIERRLPILWPRWSVRRYI